MVMLVIGTSLTGSSGHRLCHISRLTSPCSLATPLHVSELLQTMEVMSYAYSRWRKKMRAKPKVRSEEEQKTIDQAKSLLMERNGLTEAEAHRYIQKSSMDNGTGLVEVSQMILSLMGEG